MDRWIDRLTTHIAEGCYKCCEEKKLHFAP